MQVLDRDLPTTLVTVCEKGYGKRTPAADYPVKGRGSQGVITIKTNDRNGKVIAVHEVHDTDELILVTDTGRVIRIRVRDIRVQGRNTQGVRLIRLSGDERVVAVEALSEPADGSEEPLEGDATAPGVEIPEEVPEGEALEEEDLGDEEDEGDDGEDSAGEDGR
jgi:DNA gyrase subunit A